MKLTTSEAASKVGIGRVTLQRWIAARTVKAPELTISKEGRAVRLWSPADIGRLREVKAKTYRKGRGRKVGWRKYD